MKYAQILPDMLVNLTYGKS